MIKKLRKFIEKENLFEDKCNFLIALSGGIDSMVLLELMNRLQFSVQVAHFNHQLRGTESEEDEHFIKYYCKEKNYPLHITSMDIAGLAKQEGQNIQEFARELRYAWLEKIRIETKSDFILTAHHIQDSIETFILNAIKGTGLKGLSGVPLRKANVIRPLIWCTKAEIKAYAKDHEIPYREDSSNTNEKYDRNMIRRKILPLFEKLHEGYLKSMPLTIQNMNSDRELLSAFVHNYASEFLLKKAPWKHIIKKNNVRLFPARKNLMFHLFQPYGFNHSQIEDLDDCFDKTGLRFYAKEFILHIEREDIIIVRKGHEISSSEFTITGPGEYPLKENKLLRIERVKTFQTSKDKYTEYVDGDKIQFPLTLRYWITGDSFQPLGLKGKHQKLQDFFTNEKIEVNDKYHVPLLISENKIVWIAGMRLDERFKVDSSTCNYIRIQVFNQ